MMIGKRQLCRRKRIRKQFIILLPESNISMGSKMCRYINHTYIGFIFVSLVILRQHIVRQSDCHSHSKICVRVRLTVAFKSIGMSDKTTSKQCPDLESIKLVAITRCPKSRCSAPCVRSKFVLFVSVKTRQYFWKRLYVRMQTCTQPSFVRFIQFYYVLCMALRAVKMPEIFNTWRLYIEGPTHISRPSSSISINFFVPPFTLQCRVAVCRCCGAFSQTIVCHSNICHNLCHDHINNTALKRNEKERLYYWYIKIQLDSFAETEAKEPIAVERATARANLEPEREKNSDTFCAALWCRKYTL